MRKILAGRKTPSTRGLSYRVTIVHASVRLQLKLIACNSFRCNRRQFVSRCQVKAVKKCKRLIITRSIFRARISFTLVTFDVDTEATATGDKTTVGKPPGSGVVIRRYVNGMKSFTGDFWRTRLAAHPPAGEIPFGWTMPSRLSHRVSIDHANVKKPR